MRISLIAVGLLLWSGVASHATVASAGPDSSHVLSYAKPAGTSWMKDALPIDNGKMGAMVYGRVARERITEKPRATSETGDATFEQQHFAGHQRLYRRTEFVLPENSNSLLPTNERPRLSNGPDPIPFRSF